MVQGLPAVKWTPENNAKLLAAIVCLHPGALDLKKLASVFGTLIQLQILSLVYYPCLIVFMATTFVPNPSN